MALTCSWIMPNGQPCGKPLFKAYCYTHQPLASINYRREMDGYSEPDETHVGVDMGKKSKREQWKEELEQGFKEFERKGKDRTLHLKAKDFPCIVDGIRYENIQEYMELHGSRNSKYVEMPGSDQQYSFNYGHNNRRDNYPPLANSIKKEPPRPVHTLEPNSFKVCDTIRHMNYIVFRQAKGYHALWVALNAKDKLSDVVAEALKLEHPQLVPVKVLNSNIYSAEMTYTFNKSEDIFWRGGETFHRIRSRIEKAENPDYIPPNLRKLAIAATFDEAVWNVIPKNEHPKLIKWLENGCKGWWGKDPNKKWYVERGLKPPTHYHSNGNSTSSNSTSRAIVPNGLVWDWKTNSWKKPN